MFPVIGYMHMIRQWNGLCMSRLGAGRFGNEWGRRDACSSSCHLTRFFVNVSCVRSPRVTVLYDVTPPYGSRIILSAQRQLAGWQDF